MERFVSFGSTIWTIVEKAKDNDHKAISNILTSYRSPIINFCVSRGLAEADAEDITQEVLTRLVDILSKVDKSRGKFRSLILGITKNVIREHLRKETRQNVIEKEFAWNQNDEEPSFDQAWVDNIVRLAMNRLKKEKEEYFNALFMFTHQDLSYQDISTKLNCDLQTTKNHIHRGRTKLKEYIDDIIREYSLEDEYQAELEYISRLIQK